MVSAAPLCCRQAFEETARRIRTEWLRKTTDEDDEDETLAVLGKGGEKVGSLHVIIRAVDAFRWIYAKMEGGLEEAEVSVDVDASGFGEVRTASQIKLPQRSSDAKESIESDAHGSGGGRTKPRSRSVADDAEEPTQRYLLRTQSATWAELDAVLAEVLEFRAGGIFSMGASLPDWCGRAHTIPTHLHTIPTHHHTIPTHHHTISTHAHSILIHAHTISTQAQTISTHPHRNTAFSITQPLGAWTSQHVQSRHPHPHPRPTRYA